MKSVCMLPLLLLLLLTSSISSLSASSDSGVQITIKLDNLVLLEELNGTVTITVQSDKPDVDVKSITENIKAPAGAFSYNSTFNLPFATWFEWLIKLEEMDGKTVLSLEGKASLNEAYYSGVVLSDDKVTFEAEGASIVTINIKVIQAILTVDVKLKESGDENYTVTFGLDRNADHQFEKEEIYETTVLLFDNTLKAKSSALQTSYDVADFMVKIVSPEGMVASIKGIYDFERNIAVSLQDAWLDSRLVKELTCGIQHKVGEVILPIPNPVLQKTVKTLQEEPTQALIISLSALEEIKETEISEGVLSVKVIDKRFKKPLSDVSIIAISDNKVIAIGKSNEEGTVKLQLPEGSYTVKTEKSGYGLVEKSITVKAGESTKLFIELQKESPEISTRLIERAVSLLEKSWAGLAVLALAIVAVALAIGRRRS